MVPYRISHRGKHGAFIRSASDSRNHTAKSHRRFSDVPIFQRGRIRATTGTWCIWGAAPSVGASLVFTEATAVTAEGRITAEDLGIWKDAHIDFLSRIVRFIKSQGTVPGMQLAHAGRKASTQRPWEGSSKVPLENGGWVPVAPSAVAYSDNYAMPRAMIEGRNSRHRGRLRRRPRAARWTPAFMSWKFMPRTAT